MAKKKAVPKPKPASNADQGDSLTSLRSPDLAEVMTDLRDHLSRSRKVFLFGAG